MGMKAEEKALLTWVVLLLLVSLGILSSDFIPYRRIVNHQGLAAWVQAIGAIGAIYFTGQLGRKQADHTARLAAIAHLRERLMQAQAAAAHVAIARTTALHAVRALRMAYHTGTPAVENTDTRSIGNLVEVLAVALSGQREPEELRALLNVHRALQEYLQLVDRCSEDNPKGEARLMDHLRRATRMLAMSRNTCQTKVEVLKGQLATLESQL